MRKVNSMKTVIYGFLMFTVLMLVACGGAENEEKVAAGENSESESKMDSWAEEIKEKHEGTEINLAFATHPATDAYQKMTAGFEEKTGIKVNWEVIEQTHLKNKQLLDFTGGTGSYDVIMVDNFWDAEYISKGVLAPVDEYLEDTELTPEWYEYEDILPAYREGFTVDNGINYGVPISGETRILSYRKDLFEEHDKQPPETMDELLDLAEYFNNVEPDLSGIALRAERGVHYGSGWMTLLYNFSDEGFINQETDEIQMTDPSVVESLEFYNELLKNGPSDIASYTHEEALSAYMSGKTAMWLDASAIAGEIIDPDKSDVHDKVAFATPPEGPAGKAAALAGFSMGLTPESDEEEAAWAFMVYMSGKPMSEEYLSLGGPIARESHFESSEVSEDEILNPVIQKTLQEDAQALLDRGVSWVPPHENLNQMIERMGYYGVQVYHDELTAEEAAEEAQKELEEIDGD